MPEPARELIIFPTELSLRRYQQEQALEKGWVDASGHTTLVRLRQLCVPYIRLKGRRMSPAKQLLMRKQVVEVARGHFVEGGPLGQLSPAALGDVLEKLLAEMAMLPTEAMRIVDWLLDHGPRHKLYQLGILYSVWRAVIKQEGVVDQLDINASLLRVFKGPRDKWPALLRKAERLTFRSVNWFSPFEESCVAALNQKMKLRVESSLPAAHAEWAADRLGQRIRSEIMAEPWAVWAEDLGDALAVDSPDVLQLADADRINFSRSAGTYGEMEDLARRICWNLQSSNIAPNRIALVVPNIGTVQDIIPHVFARFQIPYYFRRGRPVLSSPCVKAFLAWLAFPLRGERDALIDLLRNPVLRFENRDAVVESLLKMPPRLDWQKSSLPALRPFRELEQCSGLRVSEILQEQIIEPDDHFNAAALKSVVAALEGFGEQKLPLGELVDLLEELLEEATVRPRESHEQGVWVLNPHDAVGLDFDLVLFAGLNEGEFPGVAQQDALLSDTERFFLRQHLEEQGRSLPRLALAASDVAYTQQSVQFLAALGMARTQLVLSCQAVDSEGNEKGAGEYYSKLWNLAGWCARDEIQLSPYDQWRISQLESGNIFSNHFSIQQNADAEDRIPMPGESFLPIVPLPLCRAKDEALQSAVHGGTTSSSSGDSEDAGCFHTQSPVTLKHVVEMLTIEAERARWLDTPLAEREPSKYCGQLEGMTDKITDWFSAKGEMSPTALEALAQCRYVFFLERVFGLRDPRAADDTPDPMARGDLIHKILFEIYTALAEGLEDVNVPRQWAVKGATGWSKRGEDGVNAIPLVSLLPEFSVQYVAFAEQTARRMIAEAVARKRMLGHPGVWAAEQEKVLTMVLNFVRYDIATCAAENRFPALFELKFGGESAVDLGEVKLHGIIDRIDLVFADSGELKQLRVFDYKGSSKARSKLEEYHDEIRRNLDCQLPVYAFAAQQYFFGTFNTPETNAQTQAGYLIYQRKLSDIAAALKKSVVALDEPELIEGFMQTLFANIRSLKSGDFAVDPLIETYNDYQSLCRTEAVTRDEL